MSKPLPIKIVAVGDVMLGRGIQRTSAHDAAALVAPELLSKLAGDIVTGNLECLIGSAGRPNPASHSHFQAAPSFARCLIEHFDVVSLANNHVGDFGDEAIGDTIAWLKRFGVRSVGIGLSTEEATNPALFNFDGQKIAIFGATIVGTLSRKSRYTLAVPGLDLYGRAAALRSDGFRCFLHLHAGGGDICYPAPAIRHLMNEVRSAGFSVVFGHHPHVVQGIDHTSMGTIFFSLGDFLFDKMENGRDIALLVSILLGENPATDVIQLDFAQRNSDFRLALLAGAKRAQELQRLTELSEMIPTGESDSRYLKWRGSKWRRLFQSIRRDFEAGGIAALRAKLGRANKRKLTDLLFPR
jgi:hypothetical protein